MRLIIWVAALLVMCHVATDSAGASFTSSDFAAVSLGAPGHDVVYDSFRNRIYVTVPSQNELVVVSPETRTITDRFFIGSNPRGMDISEDGSRLYIALNQAAAVAEVDLSTNIVSETVVGTQLGSSLAWDVVEAQSGNVFVTGNPGSGGFAYVVRIDTAADNAVTRVASNRIIRAGPTFLESPGADRLYVGEGFSPNSLYALDITQSTAPLVFQDNHGSVSGTQGSDISPDGQRIFLSSGQVLRSDSFLQAGRIGSGLPSVTEDGQSVLVSSGSLINIYSTATFLKTDDFLLPQGHISRHDLFAHDMGMFALSGDTLLLTQVIPIPEPGTFVSLLAAMSFALCRRRSSNGLA